MNYGMVVSQNSIELIRRQKLSFISLSGINPVGESCIKMNADGHYNLRTSCPMYGYAARHAIGDMLRSREFLRNQSVYVVVTVNPRAGVIGIGIEHIDRTRFVDELSVPAQPNPVRVILSAPVEEIGSLICRPWSSEPAETDIISIDVYVDAYRAYADAHERWRNDTLSRLLKSLVPQSASPIEKTSALRSAVVSFFREQKSPSGPESDLAKILSQAWLLLNESMPIESRYGAVFLRNIYRFFGFDAWSLENCIDSTLARSFATLVEIDVDGQRVVCVQDLTHDAAVGSTDGRPMDYLQIVTALSEGRSADVVFLNGSPLRACPGIGLDDECLSLQDRYSLPRNPLNLYLFPCVWNNHEPDASWARLFTPAATLANRAVCRSYLASEGRENELADHLSHLFVAVPTWKGAVPQGYHANFSGAITPLSASRPDDSSILAGVLKYDFSRSIDAHVKTHTETRYEGLGEEYFEWCDLVEAVLNARGRFTMFELGAGFGRWLVNAAKILQRVNPMPFRLLGVEAEPAHFKMMIKHFTNNGIPPHEHRLIEAAVNGTGKSVHFAVGHSEEWWGQSIIETNDYNNPVYTKATTREVRAVTLANIIVDYDLVDIIDLDVQGAEFEVLAAAREALQTKVKRVHIGTHGRDLERKLRELFSSMGWDCIYDYGCQMNNLTMYGECMFGDGVQSWVNPMFRGR